MKVLCIAPHPDDETIGCGGTLLRHVAEGDQVTWLIATGMREPAFTAERIEQRQRELIAVAARYKFIETRQLGFETTRLDCPPMADVVTAMSHVFQLVQPNVVYVPYRNDVHSDHGVVFDAAAACCKSFRYHSVKAVYAYETLSETEFGLRPDDPGFRPNLFVNIQEFLDSKIEIMKLYGPELRDFPFPRSEVCLRAQAALRGAQSGLSAAEAFMILKEIR